MNDFFQFAETGATESKLYKLAKEMPNKSLDNKELDKPIIKANKSDVEDNKRGGAYKDLPNIEGKQKHHMPADSTSELPYGDGPSVLIDEEDHKKTASHGNSKEAQEYRAKQKELIEQGKFDEALQMDIDDLKDKFGDKYDDGISQLKEYYEQLKEEGKVK